MLQQPTSQTLEKTSRTLEKGEGRNRILPKIENEEADHCEL